MDDYLSLRFDDDHDGTGKLTARASVDGFSGEGQAYFDVQTLKEFARSLRAYPLPEHDDQRSIASGFGDPKNLPRLDQEHIGISVYPIGRRGHIGIHIRLATALWPGWRPESQQRAVMELVTTYEPLAQFSKDLELALRDTKQEALLKGDDDRSRLSEIQT